MKNVINKPIICSWILCIAMIFTVLPSLSAQDTVFRHITPRNGLAGGYINQIEQDSLGFMWFATEQGLSKYDGYSFTNYEEDDENPDAVRSSNIRIFKLFGNNKMLVGHASGMDLLHIDEGRFTPIVLSSNLPEMGLVEDILFDEQGDLWVVSQHQHLYHFEAPDLSADTLRGQSYSFDDDEMRLRTLQEFEDQLWVGSYSGLHLFDRSENQFKSIRSDDRNTQRAIEAEIWESIIGPDGDLYISTFYGLLRKQLDDGELEFVSDIASFSEDELIDFKFQDMMVDSQDNLWLGGAMYGAVKWNLKENAFTEYRHNDDNVNTVHSPDIHYIYEDKEGNIWFGYHFLGASIMYDKSWNYTLKTPFPELQGGNPKNTILEVFTDDKGTIWATAANGLIRDLGGDDQAYFSIEDSDIDLPGNLNLLQNRIITYGNELYLTTASSVNVSTPHIAVFNTKTTEFRLIELPEDIATPQLESKIYKDLLFTGNFDGREIITINLRTDEINRIPIPVEQVYSDAQFVISSIEFLNGTDLYVKVYSLVLPDSDILQHFIYDVETGAFRTQDLSIDFPINTIQAPLRSSIEPGVSYINSEKGLIRIDNYDNSYSVSFEKRWSLSGKQ